MPKTVKTDLVLFCFKWRRANFFVILIMNTSPVSVKMGTVPLHYHHHNSSYLQSRDTNITKMSHISQTVDKAAKLRLVERNSVFE